MPFRRALRKEIVAIGKDVIKLPDPKMQGVTKLRDLSPLYISVLVHECLGQQGKMS